MNGKLDWKPMDGDHVKGASTASVILVEYADFQCPFSAAAASVIAETVSDFRDKIQFVYRHFPLSHLHPAAMLLSQFSEAAASQDLFWEAHDFLFRSQKHINDETIRSFVSKHGLDEKELFQILESQSVRAKIEKDLLTGRALGVEKTPSFILNGKLYQNEWHKSGLREELQNAFL